MNDAEFSRSVSIAVSSVKISSLYLGKSETSLGASCADDECGFLNLKGSVTIMDKLIHGIVAYMCTLGFELLSGNVFPEIGRVSLECGSMRLDERYTGYQGCDSDDQLFNGLFKRPPAKTDRVARVPLSRLQFVIDKKLAEIESSRFADWNTSLCAEDLAGIKELSLLALEESPLLLPTANDFPQSSMERRVNRRVQSQPLKGFGQTIARQSKIPNRYRLVVVGVNQAGLFTYVHTMLLLAGFRVVEARIETKRGSYAYNRYIIETFSVGAERKLRASFQCVVHPTRVVATYPFIGSSTNRNCKLKNGGIWLENGQAGYCGNFNENGLKHGFGRFFRCSSPGTLVSYQYEGEWVDDKESGVGWKLEEISNIVCFSFGVFENGILRNGAHIYPFEPPVKSVRVDPLLRPDPCMYRCLSQRSARWMRQLPREDREAFTEFLAGKKVSEKYASRLRSCWTMFLESPVANIFSMHFCQVAAVLEMIGLTRAGRLAFAKRVDGCLLEAMTENHMIEILQLESEAERNMLLQFFSVMGKAHNIDRQMRQPVHVMDALANPSITGRFFPFEDLKMVACLGQGAYGRVTYAELASSPRGYVHVALKEQIGKEMDRNACELVREWATLNALCEHRNIVKLEGVCASSSSQQFLATSLIELSLPALIYGEQVDLLTPLLILELAGDIARGIAHMHSLLIMHADIKSPNILVDLQCKKRPVARVCDFGHAAVRIGPRPQRRMCTLGWASPESLKDTETDVSSDVWSWAAVVWEMYTKEIPWKGCSHAQLIVTVGYCGLDPSGFKGSKIPERVEQERAVSELCALCWRMNPQERPSMRRVCSKVEKFSRRAFSQMHLLLSS